MSEEILTREEIDALLEGLAEEREVADITEAVLLSTVEHYESSDSEMDFQVWETGYLPARGLEEMSESLWGSVIYSGEVNAVGFYRISPPQTLRDEGERIAELDESDSLLSFVEEFLNFLATLVSDIRGLDITAEPGEVAERVPEVIKSDEGRWYEIRSRFSSSEGEWEAAIGLPEPIRIAVMGDLTTGDDMSTRTDTSTGIHKESESGMKPGERRISRARFPELDDESGPSISSPREDRMDILLDVPLQVSVELGRSVEDVRKIMALGTGSIIELDRQAGEPVDVLVNGKLLARGEVVVVDESFAVRITEIVSLEDRIRSLR